MGPRNATGRPGGGVSAASALVQEITAEDTTATVNGQGGTLRQKGRVAEALTRYTAARAAWERNLTPENNRSRLRVLTAVGAAKAALRSRVRP